MTNENTNYIDDFTKKILDRKVKSKIPDCIDFSVSKIFEGGYRARYITIITTNYNGNILYFQAGSYRDAKCSVLAAISTTIRKKIWYNSVLNSNDNFKNFKPELNNFILDQLLNSRIPSRNIEDNTEEDYLISNSIIERSKSLSHAFNILNEAVKQPTAMVDS